MPLYLLTWNPEYCDVSRTAARVAERGECASDWSTHSRRIRAGDKVVLLRQAVEPRGIVAAGEATGAPELDLDHRYYVPLVWRAFEPDLPIVSWARLQLAFPMHHWAPRCSGTLIPSPVDELLLARIENVLAFRDAREAHARRPEWLRRAFREMNGRLGEASLP